MQRGEAEFNLKNKPSSNNIIEDNKQLPGIIEARADLIVDLTMYQVFNPPRYSLSVFYKLSFKRCEGRMFYERRTHASACIYTAVHKYPDILVDLQ